MIFVVDDEESVRESTKVLLEAAGYIAECYPSGDDFLESADFNRGECLILDLHLPGLSGIEVMARLNKDAPGLSVVLISGRADDRTRKKAMSYGALAMLDKPVTATRLIEVVGNATGA